MKFGSMISSVNRSLIIKTYFIVAGLVILGVFFFYSELVQDSAREMAQVIPNIYAHFIRYSIEDNPQELMFDFIFEDIIKDIDYPIVVTDSLDYPGAWKNIPGVPDGTSLESLDQKDRTGLNLFLEDMFDREDPIIIQHEGRVIQHVYSSESELMRQLRMMPYLELLIILAFGFLGIYGLLLTSRSQQNLLWVGLAKETAHQFGTPITSLLGWLDLMRSRIETRYDDPDFLEWIDHVKKDIDHLQTIVNRFGKVGSTLKRTPVNLHELVEETIEYFNRRLPNRDRRITTHFVSKVRSSIVMMDPDLIRWTLENLIKNCIDAMQQRGGDIVITAYSKKKKVYMQVRDEGKGIPKSQFTRIFQPGVTTKKRGWGLGLSLAKRIVEVYHNGKIRVLESRQGEGTTIEVVLPEE